MKKKILSVLLATVMAFSLVFTAVAALYIAADPTSVTLYVDKSATDDTADRADGASYKTINGAFAKAVSGDTVKVTSEITCPNQMGNSVITLSDKTLTLDLNGQTVTVTNQAFVSLTGTANLTVDDSSSGKASKIVMTTANGQSTCYQVGDKSKLTVNAGAISWTQATTTTRTAMNNNTSSDAFIMVNGGSSTDGTFVGGDHRFIGLSEDVAESFATLYPAANSSLPVSTGGSGTGTIAIGYCYSGTLTLSENLDLGGFCLFPEPGTSLDIDLNGHNITGNDIILKVPETSTLSVGSSNGRGAVQNNSSETIVDTIVNYGTLVLDNGVDVHYDYPAQRNVGDSNYALCINKINAVPAVEIKSGAAVISGLGSYCTAIGYRYTSACDLTIRDGSAITGGTPLKMAGGKLAVYGGTFNSGNNALRFGLSTAVDVVSLKNFSVVSSSTTCWGVQPERLLHDTMIENLRINYTGDKSTEIAIGNAISNNSDKTVTLTGKDTYIVSGTIIDQWSTGKLVINEGIYSADPYSYVDSDSYAVVMVSDDPLRYEVVPWTEVGTDNKVTLSYNGADSATDTVEINALNDTDSLIPELPSSVFFLSSDESAYTPIDGVSVTGFTGGNKLGITKTAAAAVPNNTAYVWYGRRTVDGELTGGKSIGAITFEDAVVNNDVTISGSITGNADSLPTAKLVYDGHYYDAAVSVTGVTGKYLYTATVPYHNYDLIVSAAVGGKPVTVTALVTVLGSTVVQDVILPSSEYNSKVTFDGEGTPNIEAGGLDSISSTIGEASADNQKVTVELKVQKNDDSDHADEVGAAIVNDEMVSGIVMDTDLYRTINDGASEKISELNAKTHGAELITVVFHLPDNLQNKNGYAIFRYHGTDVDKITAIPNQYGEYFTIDTDKTVITAFLNRFSTYAIAYTENIESSNTAVDVQGKVTDSTTGLYSIALDWGNMKYSYKDTTMVWNPSTHAYEANESGSKGWNADDINAENNRITVTNHSNVGVSAFFSLSLTEMIFNETPAAASGVNGFFFAGNDEAKAAINNLDDTSQVADTLPENSVSLATAVGTAVDAAPKIDVYFAFAGTPDVGKGAEMKDFTKVGTIVITFAPIG